MADTVNSSSWVEGIAHGALANAAAAADVLDVPTHGLKFPCAPLVKPRKD